MGENANGLEDPEIAQAEAFEALMSRHYDSVAKVAYAALGSVSEVEDVLQSSFLAAFQSLKSLQDRSKFKYWVRAIAANQARDLMRHQTDFGFPDELDDLITLPDLPEMMEAMWQLDEIARHLPPRYVRVLYLRYYLGYSVKEVAEILGIDSGLVKWRASRARKMASRVLRGLPPERPIRRPRARGADSTAPEAPAAAETSTGEETMAASGLTDIKDPAIKEVEQSGQSDSGSCYSQGAPLSNNPDNLH